MNEIDSIIFNKGEINAQSEALITQARAIIEAVESSVKAPRPNFISEEDIKFDKAVVSGLKEAIKQQEELIERINARRAEMLAMVK